MGAKFKCMRQGYECIARADNGTCTSAFPFCNDRKIIITNRMRLERLSTPKLSEAIVDMMYSVRGPGNVAARIEKWLEAETDG